MLETKIHDIQTNQADKVDKMLVKNLLIGYIVSSTNKDKSQILKLISSVLDFNQTETDKVGLTKSQHQWFGGVTGVSSSHGTIFLSLYVIILFSNWIFSFFLTDEYSRESLAQAFVQFLEKESQPRVKPSEMPSLINIVRKPSIASTTTPPRPCQSISPAGSVSSSSSLTSNVPAHPVQPVLLNENQLPSFVPSRNSSSILKEVLHDAWQTNQKFCHLSIKLN